jgi:hypothetical protein
LSKGVGPDADPCEEVALSKSVEIAWGDIFNAPFIYYAVGDMSLFY